MSDQDRIAELERRIAELEKAKPAAPSAPPPPRPSAGPVDYAARLRMPASAVRAMAQTGPDPQQLVEDFRHGVSQPSSMLATPAAAPTSKPSKNGWMDQTPLGLPPGTAIIEKLTGG